MKNHVKQEDDYLNIGEDWFRNYYVDDVDMSLPGAYAVLKIRHYKSDALLAEAKCTIVDNCIQAVIDDKDTLTIPRGVTRGKYDVFLVLGELVLKVVAGEMEIVRDVSMH